ncbi:MAG TPA: hypothetical protein VF638_00810 [Sphingomonas sp.]|jgi:hypothetical protein
MKRPHTRNCSDCPGTISDENKGGRCRNCCARALAADPAVVAKRAAKRSVTMARPEIKARHRAQCKAGWLKVLEKPEALERMRHYGRTVGQRNFYRYLDPAAQAAARAAISRGLAAWCPEDRLEDNRNLKRKGVLLADRKRMILEETPGTVEHARRSVANAVDVMRIKHARTKAQEY